MAQIEHHPLRPFLPPNAVILFLGSFPPQKKRWCMDFFYPNFQNDMWRIWGLNLFADKDYFVLKEEKKFRYNKIVDFCNHYGFAFFDTASAVRRLQGNASDKFLEVVEETDIGALLTQIPHCKAIVTTGEKATDVLTGKYNCPKPKIGTNEKIIINGESYDFYRMPSSSRAYPMALSRKAEMYSVLMRYL